MDLFTIKEAKTEPVPIIISVPHAGTKFPSEIKKHYKKKMRNHIDDTDWFVHKLYNFAPRSTPRVWAPVRCRKCIASSFRMKRARADASNRLRPVRVLW